MGAKKWRDHYNEAFRGKEVVLIPENDDQGREHMMQVARSLEGICESLKWIDLPGLPPKGDVSDWIATFKNNADAGERLSVMIKGADFYTPPKKATLEDVILDVVDFKELTLEPKKSFSTPGSPSK